MAQFRGLGRTINYTVSGSAVAAGTAVTVGTLVGIAEVGGPVGAVISLTIDGVFEFVAAGAVTQGAAVYLNSNGKVTTTSQDNTALGVAVTAAAAVNDAVLVKIN